MGILDGKIGIITGAARGCGASAAKIFVQEGAKVLLTDILEEEGQQTAKDIGENAAFFKHDVTVEDEWKAAVKHAGETFGSVNFLVNNAGMLHFSTIENVDIDVCRKLVDVNLFASLFGIRAVLPMMRRGGGGSIVNVSSSEALSPANGLNIYAATKWGLRGLTRTAALELGQYNIRVNSIHPGGINTKLANPDNIPSKVFSMGFKRLPLQRPGTKEEIANAMMFLASDMSSYCCGTELAVDGGMSAGRTTRTLPGAPQD